MRDNIRNMQVTAKYIPFRGGLDTETPEIETAPGKARESQNVFQDVRSGYKTTLRYERFDGQAAPSDALYSVLEATRTDTVTVGDILTDATAAAYGTVISFTDEDIMLTKVTGIFASGDIKVGAGVVGTCVGPQQQGTAGTPKLDAQYTALAANVYREDIAAVPGSGVGRGIVEFNDVKYAFRDNLGGTATDIYKSTASGWEKVPLGFEIAFTGGGETDFYEPQVGDEIEGATSGAKATITRVVLSSGSWAAEDAAGYFVFLTQTGTFQAEKVKVVAGGPYATVATIAGDSAAISLTVGGKYEFRISNFTGNPSNEKIYGCDGVNPGFEFDGTTYSHIRTGHAVSDDKPNHICEYQNRLVFSFGPITQLSTIARPYQWARLTGSAALSISANITSFENLQGADGTGTLAIFGRNSTAMLYNNGSGDIGNWTLVNFNNDTGAIEWTTQVIGSTFFLDDKGIVDLRASQKFGNFRDAVVSDQIKTWFNQKRDQVTDSCTIKGKNLYCIFFENKKAMFGTVVNGELTSLMPQEFKHKVERIWSSEDSSGNDSTIFIDDDGYVFELDKGTSFDGEDVDWWCYLSYSHMGAPYTDKRFRRAIIEVLGSGFAEFYLSWTLNYGSVEVAQPTEILEEANLLSYNWDTFTWDLFTWDASSLQPSDVSIKSRGENISIKLRGSSDYQAQVRFSGIIIQYTNLGRTR